MSADVYPKNAVDVFISDIFSGDTIPQKTTMFGMDCKKAVENSIQFGYVLLCGSSGLNVAGFTYDKNNLSVNLNDQQITSIRQFPQLSNESLVSCHNLVIGKKSTYTYIACKGLKGNASFLEIKNPTQLFIIAVSTITGTNAIRYVSHTKVDMGKDLLSGDLDIYVNYNTLKNTELITVSNSDQSNLLTEFLGYTVSFEISSYEWSDVSLISKKNGNIINFPVP